MTLVVSWIGRKLFGGELASEAEPQLQIETEPDPDVRATPQPGDPALPRSFAEFIGQEEAVRLLQMEVAAAKRDGRPLAHILFYGPPGVGKTALANVLAAEMGGLPVYESTGAEFPSQKEVMEALGRIGELYDRTGLPVIFLLDEADGMTRIASYPLHTLMTHGYVQWQGQKYGLAPVTILGTTNHMARVHRALKSRFQEIVLIDYYSPTELSEIARRSAQRMGLSLEPGVAEWIGENAAGEPRKVNRRILRGIANLTVATTVDLATTQEALRLSGLRTKGLTRSQFGYLSFLASCEDGVAGINSIAAYLAEDALDVRDEHEPFLIRDSYVRVTRGGRKLTEKGRSYLTEVRG